MGQTMERMKEGYSKIRNEAPAHAFAYMNLIEHWGSTITLDEFHCLRIQYMNLSKKYSYRMYLDGGDI